MNLARSDGTGLACLRDIDPDTGVVIRVDRLGFLPDSVTIRLRSGQVATRAFTLRRVERPCCRLDGAWRVHLHIERLNLQQPEPTSRSITGLFVFDRRLPDWTEFRGATVDSVVRYEYGYSALDLAPFFGGPYARDVSTTVFGGGATLFRELIGMVPAGDSVDMTLIPRMSHGGLSFTGRIAGDTMRGRWTQNAYCCGADGTFTMHRAVPDATSDSIIADALRTHARDVEVRDSIERERAAAARLAADRRRAEGEPTLPPAQVSIEGNDGPEPGDHLLVGQRSRLVANVYRPGRNGATEVGGVTLAWQTSDARVLAVDSLGRVEARSPGRAYVVATVHATMVEARFAEGVADSMPIVVLADADGLGHRRFATVSAAAGGEATCAIAADRRVHCLERVPGDAPDVTYTTVLAAVAPFGPHPVRALATGIGFACALLDDGAGWCWGNNDNGELGNGDTTSGTHPRPVLGGGPFRRIVAARTHACGIEVDDTLLCWGMMPSGGLGPRAQDRCSLMIERLAAHQPEREPIRCARRPVSVLEGYRVRDIAVGDDHICVIALATGRRETPLELLCWGSIYNIDLESKSPIQMAMPPEPLVSLASGSQHVCGLTADGEAWCWGRNWGGQVGVRTAERDGSRQPVRVETDVRFRMLSAGGEHTCGIALDGRAWCWGYNVDGQLGAGIADDGGPTPVAVAGALRFVSIAAGSAHACAVSTVGGLWCWGSGLAFRAAPGSYHLQPEPFPVAGWLGQP
jgi:alpha-tubulin suppressor-like RCC1 family protein